MLEFQSRFGPLAVVSIVMLCSTTALANEQASVIVLPEIGVATRYTTDLEQTIEETLVKSGYEVLATSNLPLSSTSDSQEITRRGRDLLKASAHLVDSVEYNEAKEKLARAIAALEKSDLTETLDDLLQALTLRALIAFNTNQHNEAKATITQILTLNPGFEPEKSRITPAFRNLWDATLKKMPRKTSWEITSTPLGADLKIDGLWLGNTPLNPVGFAPGVHYVELSIPGHALVREKQTLVPGKAVSVDLTPNDAAREAVVRRQALARAKESDERLGAEVARFAKWAGADVVYIVIAPLARTNLSQLKGYKFSRRGEVIAQAAAPMPAKDSPELKPSTEALVAALEKVVAPKAPKRIAAPTVVITRDQNESWRTAGYVTLGVGMASVATGAVMGVLAITKQTAANKMPTTTQAELNTRKAETATAHLLSNAADGCLFGGAAVAVTGFVLWLTHRQPKLETQSDLVTLTPQVAPGGASLTLSGTF